MELMLLLVILPAVQDQNHPREWLKASVRAWCTAVSWLLDLRSYIFGDADSDNSEARPDNQDDDDDVDVDADAPRPQEGDQQRLAAAAAAVGLGAAHQALIQREGPIGFRPYHKPRYFALKVMNKQ